MQDFMAGTRAILFGRTDKAKSARDGRWRDGLAMAFEESIEAASA
jgi:hypothetical protein